jgi:hypothetical protein
MACANHDGNVNRVPTCLQSVVDPKVRWATLKILTLPQQGDLNSQVSTSFLDQDHSPPRIASRQPETQIGVGRLNGTVRTAPIRAVRGSSGLSPSWSRSARSNEVKNLAELRS